MLTDDPGTPAKGTWEVNLLSTIGQRREGLIFEVPKIDLNFGLANRIQLKFESPWLVEKEPGEKANAGPGNFMLGIKWRFLDKERRGIDVSIYPQLEFNNATHSVERGPVDKGKLLFLPIEAAKNIGPLSVTGEVGYRIVQHGPGEWEYGLLFVRQVSRRVELMGELHGSALRTFREGELFLNVGSRIRIARNAALLISAGRTIRNAGGQGPVNIAAFGIQFNFRNRMPRFARNK